MAEGAIIANAIPAVGTADHPIQNNNHEGGRGSQPVTIPPTKMSQFSGWVTGKCIGSLMAEKLKNDPEMMAQLEKSGMKIEDFENLFQGIMGEVMKEVSDAKLVAEDDDEEKSAISSMFE